MPAGPGRGATLPDGERAFLSVNRTAPLTLTVNGESPEPGLLEGAGAALRQGQLLIYPTDTLYALGGLALEPEAARRSRAAKGREARKPLPVVAADVEQVRRLCAGWPAAAALLADRFWPGPLSLVLTSSSAVPDEVTAGTGTIGIRVPALRLTRALCALAGPLISTSANRAGQAAPVTCADAVAQVGTGAAMALDAGPGRPTPSTIVDLTGPRPRLVRSGAVAWDEVRVALEAL